MLAFQFLFTAVILARFSRILGFGLFCVAIFAGWTEGAVEPVAVLALALFTLLAFYHKARWAWVLLMVFALLLENFLLPGFHNLRVFNQVRLTPDAIPFTMFFNYDKVAAGLLLYVIVLKPKSFSWKWPLISLAALIAVMMPVAIYIHFVRFEPKLPALGWLWALNNLLFVALAEEALFRGLIQGKLEEWLPKWKWLAIPIASALFGLEHFKGGVPYMGLAAVAGLFYGFTYYKTKSIEASMFVHFGLNLTHFLLFTYPALNV